MTNTDLKFFTNEPERDLYSRFAAILKSNTQFFDILVGYFRASGFFKMYHAMEDVEKIRILIGLNTDKYTVKIIDRAKEEMQYASLTEKEGRDAISAEIEKEFEEATTASEVEKGVRVFIDWLKSGKLEMRMYTEAPIHAKVYIMRKDQEKVPDTFGSVITGSSNFSQAGLMNNLEFNVELKDAADVHFALDKFEELWTQATDIRDTYIDTVEKKTWMRSDITPYELYLKTLYEFFKEEINSDKENFQTLLPEGYMRLQYQLDAVMQAKQKIDAYNGVFISDVVGLGKTYICAMLANAFPRATYKLIICPPVLVDYWTEVLKEFDVARCDVISLGKIDQITTNGNIDKYTYVFVDEAHRFRNSGTEAYTNLHQICRGKKVVLISATPINNYNSDIENQIYLFQDKQSGTINGVKNIEGFFRGLNSKLVSIPKGAQKYVDVMRENAEIIRDKLLREVMIRRTRGEIEQYYKDDLEKQGLTFPKAGSPEKIIYTFDEQTDETFTETVAAIKDFCYARYMPLTYLKPAVQKRPDIAMMVVGQRNMGGFMKGILVKRLESSFYAFRMTLGRFIESYEKFIDMAKKGTVYISKKVDVYDLLDDGDLDKLLYYVEQNDVMKFATTDFEPKYMRDLQRDLGTLKSLRDMWDLIHDDPKLDEFKKTLTTDKNMKGKKTIVFTESKETAQYLYENLQDIYGKRVVYYSGQSRQALKVEIEDSFNPKNKDKNNDKYDLLITTDVLAEGINLHRANVLVNYDLPWNPTRIMQRVGRINRVGSEFERIYVYNFFPTAQTKEHMPLEERILEKLQAFHDTLGEDIKYLSEDEEVSSSKAKPADGQVQNLKITEVEPNKDQPRKTFNEDDLLELADSIKQHGIITPLLVTKRNGMYMIVAGERRWRAARKAGLKEVPAVVKNLTDEEIAEIAIIENLQRVGINPIEEAFAFKQLIDNHGYTQDQVAEKISKSRVYVTNSMRLLKLTKKVQDMVIGEMLTAGHARALLSITNEADQEEIAQQVFDSNLSVRETEKLVKNLGKTTKKKTQTKANPSIDAVYADVSEKCKQALGTKVEVTSKGDGVGVIQIEFYNNDDLEKIINKLCKE